MNFEIQSVNFKSNEALNERVREKLNKLADNFPFIMSYHVFLKVEGAHDHVAEVEARLRNAGELFASAQDKDSFENAVDKLEEKLERQLRKHKEKVTRKH